MISFKPDGANCPVSVVGIIDPAWLKSSQNKKGQIPGAQFSVPFFTANSWEKDTKTVHLENFFGPSDFEAALPSWKSEFWDVWGGCS